MNKYLAAAKFYLIKGKNWLVSNKDYKVIGIAALIGLLTFSSWAALLLGFLAYGVSYLIKTKAQSLTTYINIDFHKYIYNAIIGFVIASIFLFIVK